jgi:hypothetical protein
MSISHHNITSGKEERLEALLIKYMDHSSHPIAICSTRFDDTLQFITMPHVRVSSIIERLWRCHYSIVNNAADDLKLMCVTSPTYTIESSNVSSNVRERSNEGMITVVRTGHCITVEANAGQPFNRGNVNR